MSLARRDLIAAMIHSSRKKESLSDNDVSRLFHWREGQSRTAADHRLAQAYISVREADSLIEVLDLAGSNGHQFAHQQISRRADK